MSVSNSSTNGKNERMELAATENAKVCTSVRSRYCRVERIRPSRCPLTMPGCRSAVVLSEISTGVMEVTACSNPIRGRSIGHASRSGPLPATRRKLRGEPADQEHGLIVGLLAELQCAAAQFAVDFGKRFFGAVGKS